jgi:hypothetical protein
VSCRVVEAVARAAGQFRARESAIPGVIWIEDLWSNAQVMSTCVVAQSVTEIWFQRRRARLCGRPGRNRCTFAIQLTVLASETRGNVVSGPDDSWSRCGGRRKLRCPLTFPAVAVAKAIIPGPLQPSPTSLTSRRTAPPTPPRSIAHNTLVRRTSCNHGGSLRSFTSLWGHAWRTFPPYEPD